MAEHDPKGGRARDPVLFDAYEADPLELQDVPRVRLREGGLSQSRRVLALGSQDVDGERAPGADPLQSRDPFVLTAGESRSHGLSRRRHRARKLDVDEILEANFGPAPSFEVPAGEEELGPRGYRPRSEVGSFGMVGEAYRVQTVGKRVHFHADRVGPEGPPDGGRIDPFSILGVEGLGR